VDLERVLAACGFTLQRRGRECVTRCPFHDDEHPSLRVNLERQLWYCDVCGAGGDGITFLQRYRRVDFATAVREVATC
jgi:DNA primase